MIKFKLGALENIVTVLNKISKYNLPVSLAYQISRISLQVSQELFIFSDSRQALFDQYGKRDENGELQIDDEGILELKEETLDEFTEKYNELLNIETEIDSDKISLLALDNADIKLTPIEMTALGPFINNDIE